MTTATATIEGVIAGLGRDGYVVVEGVLTEEEVAQARPRTLAIWTRDGRNSFLR